MVSALTASRDNEKLFAGQVDGKISVWDLKTGEEYESLQGHNSKISKLKVIDDLLFSGSESDDFVLCWRPRLVLDEHGFPSGIDSDNFDSIMKVNAPGIIQDFYLSKDS